MHYIVQIFRRGFLSLAMNLLFFRQIGWILHVIVYENVYMCVTFAVVTQTYLRTPFVKNLESYVQPNTHRV